MSVKIQQVWNSHNILIMLPFSRLIPRQTSCLWQVVQIWISLQRSSVTWNCPQGKGTYESSKNGSQEWGGWPQDHPLPLPHVCCRLQGRHGAAQVLPWTGSSLSWGLKGIRCGLGVGSSSLLFSSSLHSSDNHTLPFFSTSYPSFSLVHISFWELCFSAIHPFYLQGADVSAADYDLRTPLHIAARWNFLFGNFS